MSEYKVSIEMKCTFIANIFLIIVGIVSGVDLVVATAVIIFVILSVGIHILEGIHILKDIDKLESTKGVSK